VVEMILMEENKTTVSEWFNAPEYEAKNEDGAARLPKFNITLAKNEIARTEEILFLDTGTPIDNQYGKSILFHVNYKGADFVWFIKAKSFSLLKEIKREIGRYKEKGKVFSAVPAKVTRAGTTQSDTRWAIQF
jgi:hypothetical protein